MIAAKLRADMRARAMPYDAAQSIIQWPSPRYEKDPITFCKDVLDFEPWEHPEPGVSQADVIRAACVDDSRVSWVSAHKLGKSRTLAAIPLWEFATFDRTRNFLFAPKLEHIQHIALWPEIKQLYLNSGRCKSCRGKEHARCNHDAGTWRCVPQPACAYCSPIGPPSWWNDDPTHGLVSPNGAREIKAYTATVVDALGGISGQRLRFTFDETGGIKSRVIESMHGNSAGGASWLMAGNPLHRSGEQYDAHHSQKARWKTFQTGAHHSPNVQAGFKKIPGLATAEWIKDRGEAWGEKSSLYAIRVKGEYPSYEKGQLLRVDEIEASEKRWYTTEFRGRLQIGVDVGFTGDDAVIAPRRGYKINELIEVSDTTPEELAEKVMETARSLRLPHEQKPIVAYDAEGKSGTEFGRALVKYEDEIEIVPIRSSNPAKDQRRFGDKRTELAEGFANFIKRGGAIPTNEKLEGEISWMITRPKSKDDQRSVLPSNEELKKEYHRSPDRFDGCKFACAWVEDGDKLGDPKTSVPLTTTPGTTESAAKANKKPARPANDDFEPLGPYGGADSMLQTLWGQA